MCVLTGAVLLPCFASQEEAGSGLLLLSWPPLEVILKDRLPGDALVVHFLCLSLFITCCRRVRAKKAAAYLT